MTIQLQRKRHWTPLKWHSGVLLQPSDTDFSASGASVKLSADAGHDWLSSHSQMCQMVLMSGLCNTDSPQTVESAVLFTTRKKHQKTFLTAIKTVLNIEQNWFCLFENFLFSSLYTFTWKNDKSLLEAQVVCLNLCMRVSVCAWPMGNVGSYKEEWIEG